MLPGGLNRGTGTNEVVNMMAGDCAAGIIGKASADDLYFDLSMLRYNIGVDCNRVIFGNRPICTLYGVRISEGYTIGIVEVVSIATAVFMPAGIYLCWPNVPPVSRLTCSLHDDTTRTIKEIAFVLIVGFASQHAVA